MMAKLFIYDDALETNNLNQISYFLAKEGIQVGKFELNELSKKFSKLNTLTDKQRIELLTSYPELTKKYSRLDGYRSDIVCLYPEFEHFNFIMKKFGDIHFHFESEYWYFFDGYFGFVFLGSQGRKYLVTIESGEYIQVPEGKWQYFSGTNKQRMKAMRFFNTTHQFIKPEKVNFIGETV